MSGPTDRHPSVAWETVAHYLRRGQSVVWPLSDRPDRAVTYETDGASASVALLVELTRGERCPRSPSTNVEVTEVVSRGVRCARLRTKSPELVRDFHELAFAVAARVVYDEASLSKALADTIRSWHRLIDVRSAQLGRRIGLHGELAVLYSIALDRGWEVAVNAWVGPTGEVHDFALPDFDIEVKTTSSEGRTHTINGLEQLTPKPGRKLWCASLQLARGGAAGRTLGDSLDACLTAARTTSTHVEARLADSLTKAGADDLVLTDTADVDRWSVRSTPLVLNSSHTPSIDAAALRNHASGRISDVSYTVNLTGLSPSPDTPFDLTDIRLP